MAMEIFFNNAYIWSKQLPHQVWDIFWSTVDSIKILKASDFPIGLYGGWQKRANRNTNLWENFKESVIYWKNLKLDVVITWTISTVQKNFHCHSNMPGGIWFFGPYFARVYTLWSPTLQLSHDTGMSCHNYNNYCYILLICSNNCYDCGRTFSVIRAVCYPLLFLLPEECGTLAVTKLACLGNYNWGTRYPGSDTPTCSCMDSISAGI